MKTEAGLTPKQEKFCVVYIETGNASEAYRRAYNAEKMNPRTIERRAAELLDNSKVAVRIAALQAKSAEVHDITVAKLTDMALKAYEAAMKDGASPGAAVSAVHILGKLHGHIVERKHVVADHQHAHLHGSIQATSEWLAKLLGRDGEEPALPKPLQN